MHYDISSFLSLEGELVSYCMPPGKEKEEEEGRRGRGGEKAPLLWAYNPCLLAWRMGKKKRALLKRSVLCPQRGIINRQRNIQLILN